MSAKKRARKDRDREVAAFAEVADIERSDAAEIIDAQQRAARDLAAAARRYSEQLGFSNWSGAAVSFWAYSSQGSPSHVLTIQRDAGDRPAPAVLGTRAAASPPPVPESLRSALAHWLVSACGMVAQIRRDAEEMVDEMKRHGSPLRALVELGEMAAVMHHAEDTEKELAAVTVLPEPDACPLGDPVGFILRQQDQPKPGTQAPA